MRTGHAFYLTGILLTILVPGLCAKQVPESPLYDEATLRSEMNEFIEGLDFLRICKDYPKAIQNLFSAISEKQIQAVKTLAETGEIEAIPWMLPFLDAKDENLRISTGASLEKLVSSNVLKRRDVNRLGSILIRPLGPAENDLRPLAWIVLKMLRNSDDGNTQAYAVSMARYLGLYAFERELEQCLDSRHPAVANKAKWALESLKRQMEYEMTISNKPDEDDDK